MPLHLLLGRGAVIASSSSLWLPEGPPLNMKAWGEFSAEGEEPRPLLHTGVFLWLVAV